MRRRLVNALAAGVLALGLGGPVAAGAQAVRVGIDPSRPGPVVDRDIFGQFAEHLGYGIYGGVWVGPDSKIPNVRGIRSDVVGALKALKVPNVRWPGGCFADEYHWRDGIGPADQRPAGINANWGNAIEPNTFGTHEFMDFADQIGAEAYVSVNVGSGTVKEAADWLAYMTAPTTTTLGKERAANGHPAPYKVKFLGIGNENWGCGGSMTGEFYVDQLKMYARYVRNFDPAQTGEAAMERIAVGPDGDKTEYTEEVMKAWKNRTWAWSIEGLSLHFYTTGGWPPSYASTGFGETEYAKLLKETLSMDGRIAKHTAIMDRYDPEKKVYLAVDEWGVWLAPAPGTNPGFLIQQNSLRDAVLASLNINIFARHADRVRVANIAQMVNVLQAMILTDGEKMLLTPTYHVFRMYTPFQDATLLPVSFESGEYRTGDVVLPAIDAVAVRGKDGAVWLAVTNLNPRQAAEIEPQVAGRRARAASGEVLTAAEVSAHNTFAAPNTVAPRKISAEARGGRLSLRLPPKSVTVVRLDF